MGHPKDLKFLFSGVVTSCTQKFCAGGLWNVCPAAAGSSHLLDRPAAVGAGRGCVMRVQEAPQAPPTASEYWSFWGRREGLRQKTLRAINFCDLKSYFELFFSKTQHSRKPCCCAPRAVSPLLICKLGRETRSHQGSSAFTIICQSRELGLFTADPRNPIFCPMQ